MAQGRKAQPERTPPNVPLQKGVELLERRIAEGDALGQRAVTVNDYAEWRTHTAGTLIMVYGTPSPELAAFHESAVIVRRVHSSRDRVRVDEAAERAQRLERQLVRLRAFVKTLKDRIDAEGAHATPVNTTKPLDTKVFLVHGRKQVRDTVARFIEKLKLEVTILDELPDKGRTLIKKFEEEAGEARFAVVLLTDDDVGCLAEDLRKKASDSEKVAALRPRARQNAVFELGYFRAKLGEGNVCALCDVGVDIPSDFAGVMVICLNGDWRLSLARELKAAKLPVDLNDTIG